MRPLLRVAFIALGLTELYSLLLLAPLLHPRHMALYHWTAPAWMLFLPAVLDIALLWLLMAVLLHAVRRPGKLRDALWCAVFLLTPPIVATEWSLLWRTDSRLPTLGRLYMAAAVAVAAGLLAFARARVSIRPLWVRTIAFASTALFFFGLGGALLLAQLVCCAWQARSLNESQPLHRRASVAARPRILWIVFDELSFQQVYERRLPGLQLPAFDALAAQSTVFTHTVPAGNFTDSVMPSLLSGAPVDTVRATPAGHLLVHRADTDRWTPFDPRQTIFQDALDAGYSPAVAGWYLPYCRLLAPVLDRCFSSYEIGVKSGLSPDSSLAVNMAEPFRAVAGALLPALASPREVRTHIADYESLTRAANRLLDDPAATFVLLHLPIPHPGGIYNRATGHLTTGPATYLDNLALADRSLALIRARLEQAGQWDATTILLMGDHGWRVTPAVSDPEERLATHGGVFDPRPAYLLKLPHQHTGGTLPQPFPALRTRSLLEALLQGKIQTPAALARWANRQP